MVTCFILAGQIVLSLSAPLVVIENNGTETEADMVQTIIFPKDAGVHIFDGGNDTANFEFFEGGQKQHDPTALSPFMISYDEVVAALSNCRTD
jgi:hypothetical protein